MPIAYDLALNEIKKHLRSGDVIFTRLNAAMDASSANGKGEVLALIDADGMMRNIQELQTIEKNKLPIKIIVFEKNGANRDLCKIAQAFKITTCSVIKWETLLQRLELLFKFKGPFVMVVHTETCIA